MPANIHVKVNEVDVGHLTAEKGSYLFGYNKESVHVERHCHPDIYNDDSFPRISLTMPVRTRNYINETHLHPIFEMHLPEGYLLSVIKRHFSKLLKIDDFGLLKLISPNIKGKITYEVENEDLNHVSNVSDGEHVLLKDLLFSNNQQLFSDLVSKFALSSALSGVQPKVMAKVMDKATLNVSDYIVKSWGDDYPQLALNEYYCMLVAKYAGISVPEFYLSDDAKLFIMKRFDITEKKKYLGFEDMCVLQAKKCDDKYDSTYEKIAMTIKTFVSPSQKHPSLKAYFKMMVVNNLVQNGDAHLKNFGVLYSSLENIKLAPAYDIVCTTVYIKNDIPALLMQGSKKWFNQKALLHFGMTVCNLSAKDAGLAYQECIDAIQKVLIMLIEKIENEIDIEKIDVLKKMQYIFARGIK
jgi:serine/threonine-protein kinase HipA